MKDRERKVAMRQAKVGDVSRERHGIHLQMSRSYTLPPSPPGQTLEELVNAGGYGSVSDRWNVYRDEMRSVLVGGVGIAPVAYVARVVPSSSHRRTIIKNDDVCRAMGVVGMRGANVAEFLAFFGEYRGDTPLTEIRFTTTWSKNVGENERVVLRPVVTWSLSLSSRDPSALIVVDDGANSIVQVPVLHLSSAITFNQRDCFLVVPIDH